MRIICSPTLLAQTLASMSRLLKQEVLPSSSCVLLRAQRAEQSTVILLGIGRNGMVGMFNQVPATLEEEGQVLVPIEPFAEYIGLLSGTAVTLSQARAELTAQEVPQLTVESRTTSPAGTTATDTAHFASLLWDDYRMPPPGTMAGQEDSHRNRSGGHAP